MTVNDEYRKEIVNWLVNYLEELTDQRGQNTQINNLYLKGYEFLKKLEDKNATMSTSEVQMEAESLYKGFTEREYNRGGEENKSFSTMVPIGGHKLPNLPYSYNALEPYIQSRIMELHHKKHHQSYVDGLNRAEKKLQQQRDTNRFEEVKHWQRELAFNGAGHYLHSLFWEMMSPNGGGKPKGMLKDYIERDFGSFESFKKHFTEAATNVEGSGWAILVWSPMPSRLEILTAEKHQNLTQWDVVPLLPLDVWEHAYYLQYENDRKKYVTNFWNVVNWKAVENRFLKVREL